MNSATITLSDTNAHNLFNVLTGADVTGAATGGTFTAAELPTKASVLSFQADIANNSKVRGGDSSVTDTNCGFVLQAGDEAGRGPFIAPKTALADYYLKAEAATQKINVMWEV